MKEKIENHTGNNESNSSLNIQADPLFLPRKFFIWPPIDGQVYGQRTAPFFPAKLVTIQTTSPRMWVHTVDGTLPQKVTCPNFDVEATDVQTNVIWMVHAADALMKRVQTKLYDSFTMVTVMVNGDSTSQWVVMHD